MDTSPITAEPIWRVSFLSWVGEPDLIAEGPAASVREAIHPYLAERQQEGYSLADLLPWLDWEVVAG